MMTPRAIGRLALFLLLGTIVVCVVEALLPRVTYFMPRGGTTLPSRLPILWWYSLLQMPGGGRTVFFQLIVVPSACILRGLLPTAAIAFALKAVGVGRDWPWAARLAVGATLATPALAMSWPDALSVFLGGTVASFALFPRRRDVVAGSDLVPRTTAHST